MRELLKIFGIKLPVQLGHGVFDSTVRESIEADAALAHALIPMLEARVPSIKSFGELDRRVKAMARADTLCQLLMTAPGVGPITALTYKAAVDVSRGYREPVQSDFAGGAELARTAAPWRYSAGA